MTDHDETRVICPQCQREGQRSTVTLQGARTTTLLNVLERYDEAGRPVPPLNHNTITSTYRCSRGHDFRIRA